MIILAQSQQVTSQVSDGVLIIECPADVDPDFREIIKRHGIPQDYEPSTWDYSIIDGIQRWEITL